MNDIFRRIDDLIIVVYQLFVQIIIFDKTYHVYKIRKEFDISRET
jgi:hypothetical protein